MSGLKWLAWTPSGWFSFCFSCFDWLLGSSIFAYKLPYCLPVLKCSFVNHCSCELWRFYCLGWVSHIKLNLSPENSLDICSCFLSSFTGWFRRYSDHIFIDFDFDCVFMELTSEFLYSHSSLVFLLGINFSCAIIFINFFLFNAQKKQLVIFNFFELVH